MRTTRWLVPSVLAGLLATAAHTYGQRREPAPRPAQPQRARDDQPQPDRLLRQMSNTLSRMQSFRVTTDFALEVVTREGQKLEMVGTSNVAVRRPNGLRVDRRGEQTDLSFFYDGRSMTLYGRGNDMYATVEAPPNLDEAIDFARERLDIEAPGADLLYSDPYRILTEDARQGTYVGRAVIDGIVCHHIAYRGENVDWQLWIDAGDRPLPRRYNIVTKDVQGQPEFTVNLRDWETDVALPETLFTFTAPAGAQQIEFLALREEREERAPRAQTGRGARRERR
jgi:hypothetical protein